MAREVSLWLLGVLSFALLLTARELGSLARRWHDRRRPGSDSEREDFSMTSVLGLLALLIGFTFSLALLRYEERRELVIQEANAIGTTWLRYGLLDAGDRDRLRTLMRRYVDARVAFGRSDTPTEEAAANQQSATARRRWHACAPRCWLRSSSNRSTRASISPVRARRIAKRTFPPAYCACCWNSGSSQRR